MMVIHFGFFSNFQLESALAIDNLVSFLSLLLCTNMLHITVLLQPCFCGTHIPHLAQAAAAALPATHAVYLQDFEHPPDHDTVFFLAPSQPSEAWGPCPVAAFLGDVIKHNEGYLRHVGRTNADEIRL